MEGGGGDVVLVARLKLAIGVHCSELEELGSK